RGGSAGLFGWAVLRVKGGAAQSSQISANAPPDVGGAAWAFICRCSRRAYQGGEQQQGFLPVARLAMERRPP
ncbi:unnamed protein product, partial [Ectocarpus sp. 4 AP-2014]